MAEWSLGEVNEVVSSAIPERVMVVSRGVRRTYGEVRDRTRALASYFGARGLGVHRERGDLERWECGQDRVAVLMHNRVEHLETLLGCWKARIVPCNVNYHYTPGEVAALLRIVGARAVVYERGLAPKLQEAIDELDLLVEVDDGSEEHTLPGAEHFEAALALGANGAVPASSPDDGYLACTGGTTGRPKGVLWRQADIFVAGMGGTDDMTADALRARAQAGGGVWFPASPLMHVAAQWTALLATHLGATVVLHDDSARFDARTILETAAAERATMMTIVGDAYARPMIDELRAREYDLSELRLIGTGGTATSLELKRALHDLLPQATVRDGYGASEIGAMASGDTPEGPGEQRFTLGADARLLSADRTRFLDPVDEEVGWLAKCRRVPLGYLDDPAATTETFPSVDGIRVAIPGDRARFDADGMVVLLGRDSLVVNTGGEKVFVEEVEDVLKQHPEVIDALVIGRANERFGQEVVAIVQVSPAARPEPQDLREWCAARLARYKAPRAFAFTELVERHPSGKANYQWATKMAQRATSVSGETGSAQRAG